MRRRSVLYVTASAVIGLAPTGCDERLAMQPARDHGTVQMAGIADAAPERAEPSGAGRGADRPQRLPVSVPLVQGRPMWADNRNYSAAENAQYQYEHHGAELGARDLDDFVDKAHRFVNSPPWGVKTLTRANGDTLMFDPGSQLFGVVRADGAPRTVFRPETGEAYWNEQVATQGETRRVVARAGG